MANSKPRLTMDRPAPYQIKVPGQLDPSWAEWAEGLTISIVDERDGWPVSTLSLTIDQAGLTGLLRRLYALGLPLISVTWVE